MAGVHTGVDEDDPRSMRNVEILRLFPIIRAAKRSVSAMRSFSPQDSLARERCQRAWRSNISWTLIIEKSPFEGRFPPYCARLNVHSRMFDR